MKSKTIILSSPDEKGRGIMTIFTEEDLLQIRLRLYNIEELSKDCKVGIYHKEQTFTSNLLKKNDVYQSSMVGEFDLNSDFYSAIIDTANNNSVKLSGGTYAGCFFNDNSVFEDSTPLFSENESTQEISDSSKNVSNEDPSLCPSESQPQSHSPFKATECDDCEKCAHCKYKEFFYSQLPANEEISKTTFISYHSEPSHSDTLQRNPSCRTEKTAPPSENEQPSAYSLQPKSEVAHSNDFALHPSENEQPSALGDLLPQFDYIFQNYPQDENLSKLLPNSKFVKISTSKEQYSLGALYENEEMKYICYAVFSEYNSSPPVELGEHHQWLPLDKEDPLSEGYYIVFQDAKDLKIVEL